MTKPKSPHGNNEKSSLTADQARRQRGRSIAIASILAGLAVMFFVMTLVRLGSQGGG